MCETPTLLDTIGTLMLVAFAILGVLTSYGWLRGDIAISASRRGHKRGS
jgi:hypothetical protein